MRTRRYPGQLSRFGGSAAMLISLMPCADNCAQDVKTPTPLGATLAATEITRVSQCRFSGPDMIGCRLTVRRAFHRP
jgi:hypothetical protein